MSTPNENGSAPIVEPPLYTIVITVDKAGRVNVNGPMNNLVVMYGLLETAKDITRTTAKELADRLIQPATAGEVALIKQ